MTLLGLLIFILIPLVSSRGLRFMSTVNALNLNKTIMNYKFLFKITSNGCPLKTAIYNTASQFIMDKGCWFKPPSKFP